MSDDRRGGLFGLVVAQEQLRIAGLQRGCSRREASGQRKGVVGEHEEVDFSAARGDLRGARHGAGGHLRQHPNK